MFRKRDLQNKVEISEKLKLGAKKGGRETGWEESAAERHSGDQVTTGGSTSEHCQAPVRLGEPTSMRGKCRRWVKGCQDEFRETSITRV